MRDTYVLTYSGHGRFIRHYTGNPRQARRVARYLKLEGYRVQTVRADSFRNAIQRAGRRLERRGVL